MRRGERKYVRASEPDGRQENETMRKTVFFFFFFFFSANNVFVYSIRVVRRKTTILVYVHQYLDSSRKPNESRICENANGLGADGNSTDCKRAVALIYLFISL